MMDEAYRPRTQYQPFKFEVGIEVVFMFCSQPAAGKIESRCVDHNGDNVYRIRVRHDLVRTVLERNIHHVKRDARSLEPGMFHGEILPPPPPGEVQVRADDVSFEGWVS